MTRLRAVLSGRAIGAALLAALAAPAAAQTLTTYTESRSGSDTLALGYPVPLPVASLTPVDGFRDYPSLHARLQSLAVGTDVLEAHAVGKSASGRDVWAYVVGSAGDTDREGRSRPAFFINATTHAREWAAAEVATGLIERLVEGADDGGWVRYLLDTTRVVVIPVHNVDGFLQTQRFPAETLIGRDPCSPTVWPRDGRMRRKNMRGADELLSTLDDHLRGVDLNRNHPPFWRTQASNAPCPGGSSPNPDNLLHHGSGAHSEVESRAMLQAAQLGPASRMRLGVDVHSYAQVFYSSNTGRERLNAIQSDLLEVVGNHHVEVPTAAAARNGRRYRDIPDPNNRGIGAAAEFFAYEWRVPAWTLELEPGGGAREYGGFGVSHDGFILPASEIGRVREAWAESFLVTFYYLAGAPHLERLRVFDAASDALLLERRWRFEPTGLQRVRHDSASGPIAGGQQVRIELSFSKPMRHRVDGEVAQLPGQQVALLPTVGLVSADGSGTPLDTSAGRWAGDAGLRYRDDTFVFETTMPQAFGRFALRVQATDMVGLDLDADPSTPVDWHNGAWADWDADIGLPGDSGGTDALTGAGVLLAGRVDDITIASIPSVAGEGDLLRLRLTRHAPADEAVQIVAESPEAAAIRAIVSPPPPPAPFVEWAAGETGERWLDIPLRDDADINGSRIERVSLSRADADAFVLYTEFPLEVLDNDRAGRTVIRAHRPVWPGAQTPIGLEAAGDPGATLELVLDADREYFIRPREDGGAPVVAGGVTIHGNQARLRPSAGHAAACLDRSLLEVGVGGVLRLAGLRIEADPLRDRCGLRNRGSLAIERSLLRNLAPAAGASIDSNGLLTVRRSQLVRDSADAARSTVRVSGGSARIDQSLITGPSAPDRSPGVSGTAIELAGGALTIHASTLAGDAPVDGSSAVPAILQSSLLFDADPGRLATPVGPVRSCSAPLLLTDARNLFAPFHSPDAVRQGGCIDVRPGDGVVAHDIPALRAAPPVAEPVRPRSVLTPVEPPDCSGVDLHGRPRPQGPVLIDCEAGAVEIGVNPYRGIWNGARDGHGIDIETVGNTLFLLWYTYDDAGEPIAYHAAAALTGSTWQAPLMQTRRDPANGALAAGVVGSIGLEFASATEATLRWRFDVGGVDGEEALHAYVFAEGEPRFEVTGHWFPPGDSGHGVSVFRRGEVTAAVLYYYDAAGTMRWMLGSGAAGDALRLSMASYTGFCPDCSVEAMPVRSQTAGTVTLQFLTPERARFAIDVVYPGPSGGRWRRDAADFVPLGDPVDQRLIR